MQLPFVSVSTSSVGRPHQSTVVEEPWLLEPKIVIVPDPFFLVHAKQISEIFVKQNHCV